MRDVEFRQIRSFEARQMAGPTLNSSLFPTHIPASSTTSPNLRRRRIYKKVGTAHRPASRNALQRSHHAAAQERPPALPVALRLHADRHRQKRRSAACSFWKNPRLRGPSKVTISLAPAHRRSALRFVLESRAGGRMAIHLRTSFAGSRERMTTFGLHRVFPAHVSPQAARVDHEVYRRKVAHNQIKIEVKRLRSS
jgi:hypothetical protein